MKIIYFYYISMAYSFYGVIRIDPDDTDPA